MRKKPPRLGEGSAAEKLFGGRVPIGFNVDLSLMFGHEFLAYADGYKLAGDTLVQNLRRYKQALVFPACYLYRHYLELMVKALTRLAGFVVRESADFENHHNLEHLWRVCRPLLERAMPGCSKAGFSDVEKCLKAFGFDFNGEFSRFPEGRDHLPWQQPVESINLQRMRDAVAAVANLFDSYYLEMNSIVERRAEAAS